MTVTTDIPAHTTDTYSDRVHRFTGIFADLLTDWRRSSSNPTINHQATRWGRTHPALADATGLDDILDRLSPTHPANTDAVLLALISHFQAGQSLAGRTLLQAMAPMLAGMSHRVLHHHPVEERQQAVVATFWDVISRYNPTRARNVASNLRYDTLHAVTKDQHARTKQRTITETPVDPTTAAELAADTAVVIDLTPTADTPLIEVVMWALDQRVISRSDAQLIARIYLSSDTTTSPVPHAAAELGISAAAVRKRCSRIAAVIAAAVVDDAGAGQDTDADSSSSNAAVSGSNSKSNRSA